GLYLDCFSGISGDMLLGALVDLGVDPARLRAELRKLPISGYSLTARKVRRGQLAGTKVDVEISSRKAQPKRGVREVRAIVEKSRPATAGRGGAVAALG